MSKRKKFIFSSLLLSLGFVGIQFVESTFRYPTIAALAVLTFILFFWSLKENLRFDFSLTALVLPVMFTLGVGLFWFLLPSSILARIPVILLYGSGIYALFLTMNIYTVGAIRTIALLRAARGVGFVLTLLTTFLLFDAFVSLKAPVYVNAISAFFISFPLFFQGLWAVKLETRVSKQIVLYTFVFSMVVAEIALSIYFWPVTVVVGSLFLTVSHYMLLGIGQSDLEGRLFQQIVREYVVVGAFVILGMFVATRWG